MKKSSKGYDIMPKLRLLLNLTALALCSGVFALPAKAQPVPTTVQQVITSVATVESVDRSSREVLLSAPSGDLVTVVAGPQVRNFDKIRAGDQVVVSYQQAIGVRLSTPGGTLPQPTAQSGALRAARGELPAGAAYTLVDLHVRINSVDIKTGTVNFTRADGSIGSIVVHNPAMLKFAGGLKPGDNVEVQGLQAVTIQVQKAP
jgi:hypothetical protein